MRLRFLRDVRYENEGRNKGPMYHKDTEHDFPDAFAQRWLRRGVAVIVEPPATRAKAAAKPE